MKMFVVAFFPCIPDRFALRSFRATSNLITSSNVTFGLCEPNIGWSLRSRAFRIRPHHSARE